MKKVLWIAPLAVATILLGLALNQKPPQPPTEPYKILYPTNYSGAAPLVLWFHGSGPDKGNEELLLKSPTVEPNVKAFLGAGYIVATSNARGDNWGSPQSQQDYIDLYNYIARTHTITDVYFWATSMGGLDGLYVLRSREIPVKAFIGMSPVTNLQSVARNDMLGKYVQRQWGGMPNVPSPIDYEDYPDIPYLFYASYDDTYVVRKDNLDKLSIPNKRVVASTGDHDDHSNFVQPEALVKFLDDIR